MTVHTSQEIEKLSSLWSDVCLLFFFFLFFILNKHTCSTLIFRGLRFGAGAVETRILQVVSYKYWRVQGLVLQWASYPLFHQVSYTPVCIWTLLIIFIRFALKYISWDIGCFFCSFSRISTYVELHLSMSLDGFSFSFSFINKMCST